MDVILLDKLGRRMVRASDGAQMMAIGVTGTSAACGTCCEGTCLKPSSPIRTLSVSLALAAEMVKVYGGLETVTNIWAGGGTVSMPATYLETDNGWEASGIAAICVGFEASDPDYSGPGIGCNATGSLLAVVEVLVKVSGPPCTLSGFLNVACNPPCTDCDPNKGTTTSSDMTQSPGVYAGNAVEPTNVDTGSITVVGIPGNVGFTGSGRGVEDGSATITFSTNAYTPTDPVTCTCTGTLGTTTATGDAPCAVFDAYFYSATCVQTGSTVAMQAKLETVGPEASPTGKPADTGWVGTSPPFTRTIWRCKGSQPPPFPRPPPYSCPTGPRYCANPDITATYISGGSPESPCPSGSVIASLVAANPSFYGIPVDADGRPQEGTYSWVSEAGCVYMITVTCGTGTYCEIPSYNVVFDTSGAAQDGCPSTDEIAGEVSADPASFGIPLDGSGNPLTGVYPYVTEAGCKYWIYVTC